MFRTAAAATWASLAVGVVVFGLKWVAWELTGSVALYSDALESIINIAAAVGAVIAVRIAAAPADDDHPWGHTKAEYFSAVAEGVLIVLAALAILNAAWERWQDPQPIAAALTGALVSAGASGLNGVLGLLLLRTGRRLHSPALRADGAHVLTDVATSVGVLIGIGLAASTGWWVLDPLVAALVAINIVWSGSQIVRESVGALMDESLPPAEREAIRSTVRAAVGPEPLIEGLRARRAGHRAFVEVRLLVPAEMSVGDAHALCDAAEAAVESVHKGAETVVHVEPLRAPARATGS